jgi:hypothetical protein
MIAMTDYPPPTFDVATWLDRCEADLTHPDVVEQRLRHSGWGPVPAAQLAGEYRRRFNEHALGYSALLVATGVSALAAGSTAHTLIAGLTRPVHRSVLALWLTILVCALPFAGWAHWWAARVDRDDPVAVWSAPRRTLAQVLLWACGFVGIGRLMLYVGELVGVLVGARPATGAAIAAGALNVCVVVGIALPLGLWAFRFLHRFDAEDPTAPTVHRRRLS